MSPHLGIPTSDAAAMLRSKNYVVLTQRRTDRPGQPPYKRIHRGDSEKVLHAVRLQTVLIFSSALWRPTQYLTKSEFCTKGSNLMLLPSVRTVHHFFIWKAQKGRNLFSSKPTSYYAFVNKYFKQLPVKNNCGVSLLVCFYQRTAYLEKLLGRIPLFHSTAGFPGPPHKGAIFGETIVLQHTELQQRLLQDTWQDHLIGCLWRRTIRPWPPPRIVIITGSRINPFPD